MRFKALVYTVTLAVAAILTAGCSAGMQNLTYGRGWGQVARLNYPVVAAVIPAADERPDAKTYPKQVIKNVNYSDEVEYEINDRTVSDVLDHALSEELRQHGATVVVPDGVRGPLDKSTFEDVKARLQRDYPDVQAAVGYEILDFMATSKRNLLSYDITISARVRFYAMDVSTGKIVNMEYNTEWTDWTLTLDRDYMIKQLDKALVDIMKNTVRDNLALRDLLVSSSSH